MFTERIDRTTGLRPITVRDADVFFSIIQSCREYLDEWVPWVGSIGSIDEMRKVIATKISQLDGKGPQFCMLEQNRVVGWMGYTRMDWEGRSVEIEYWLGQEFQGKGTTSKCCRCLTDYALNELEMERVIICTAEENTKSMRIPIRLGFRQEMVLEKADNIHGQDINLVLFSFYKDTLRK